VRNARVAVVASIGFESFSYSTLEAMAAARPTIVTRTGALPELIDHERTGLVVTPDEPHEMAAGLERLLADRSLSDSCRLAAYAKARKQYDTGVVLPRMMEAYESAANFFYGDRDVPSPLKSSRKNILIRPMARALASVA